ncbi:hypothetical protein AK830_g11926 [Neonectria ditissima]|uniref:Aminoglycoside phosphotransferase domain-containing protein n=1 Tax=Neonectria ditissima TaxID=78410 RepID=A0A0P7AQE5_9HYPO|nr:hypothetical protein AK830_g11926 [Neonectria ditissima]
MTPPFELEDQGPITYSWAEKKDGNIINQLAYVPSLKELYEELLRKENTICSLVRHHLQLGHDEVCTVLPQADWIRGSFNVCVPVEMTSGTSCRKVMLRCCLPHKLAEAWYSGTIDEKLSCEAGTYAWMQENCSDVRIPHLYGFGFTDHRHYTHEAHRPWYIRLFRMLQRPFNSILRRTTLSHYTPNSSSHRLPTAYMLLEHIGPNVGQMLSNTWNRQRDDVHRRRRLFRGIARAMLSLARTPQPRIGSFQFHDDCCVRLTNRPLTCSMMILENDGTPRTIQRTETHSCTESFVSDMLLFHDNRLLTDPNIVYDEADCQGNMAAKALLRALSHKYIKRELRNGPYVLQFTDLHASNIFVDEAWNVTCCIDLEWIAALPAEMLAVPYWLTGCKLDEVEGARLSEFDEIRQEFMLILKEEEKKAAASHSIPLSRVMEEMWDSKGVWFWYCLESVNAMYYLVSDHICPQYGASLSPKMEAILSKFWCADSQGMIKKKMDKLEEYQMKLRQVFQQGELRTSRTS